ncbi:MAG: Rnf-Nqr domain containing protein [Acholeplasma sp.]|nr:Rnf-Nqr domain containing protein [Acholeplasma sp.]
MDVKGLNIFNVFKKRTVTEKSMAILAITLLPALFVTNSLEATILYLIYFLVYLILVLLVQMLIKKVFPKEMAIYASVIGSVGVAIIVSQFIDAFHIGFANNYLLYIYLFAINLIPIMVKEDNDDLGKSLVDGIQSFLGFAVIVIIVALIREVLGTGSIVFGNYTNVKFSLKLFESSKALLIFNNAFSNFIILGIVLAIVQLVLNRKEEVK